jgi:hypothetical protein
MDVNPEEGNDELGDPEDEKDDDDEDSQKEDEEENVQVGIDSDSDEESKYKEEAESDVASTLPDDEEVENEELKEDDRSNEPESQLLFDQISKLEEADIGQLSTSNHKFVKLNDHFHEI